MFHLTALLCLPCFYPAGNITIFHRNIPHARMLSCGQAQLGAECLAVQLMKENYADKCFPMFVKTTVRSLLLIPNISSLAKLVFQEAFR